MDVNSLVELQARGDFGGMEQAARHLLGGSPEDPTLHNALGISLAMQQRFAEAAYAFGQATALAPQFAEAQNNLGNVLRDLGRRSEAVESYRAALRGSPISIEAHLNLAIVLVELGRAQEGRHHLQQAIAISPDVAGLHMAYARLFGGAAGDATNLLSYLRASAIASDLAAAHAESAKILHGCRRFPEAERLFRRSLAADPGNAAFLTGFANLHRDRGRIQDALAACARAIAADPLHAEAHHTRGMLFRGQGNVPSALKSYAATIAIAPAASAAIHNLGLALYESGRLDTAVLYLDRSDLPGAAPRSLHANYRLQNFDVFRRKLAKLARKPNVFPLVANLSAHHAANFGTRDPYDFCPNPFDFIHQAKLDAPAASRQLIGELLEAIDHDAGSGTTQPLLHEGVQSSGDLLDRPAPAFSRLAELVKRHIAAYRKRFSPGNCAFIREFPETHRFYSSWYVRIRQGGHLASHIHESGWLSGVVYLTMPPRQGNGMEGCIQFSIDGGDYPATHANFPSRTLTVDVGDIVLFPSSLFHRTIPFDSADERICIAFDMAPKEFPA